MGVYIYEYDSHYYPAMPVIEIQLRRRAQQSPLILKGVVDSGADATMIPLLYLRQLKARKGQTKWLRGVAGVRYEVDLYTVSIQIGTHQAVYTDVVGTEQPDEVIIG